MVALDWFALYVVGVMANFTGATSQLYAALNYEVSLSNKYTDPWTFNLTKIYLFLWP